MPTTKVKLTEALHARPANLLVRLASTFDATVIIRKGKCGANAHNILEVLALGAAMGDDVEIEVSGAAEAEAAASIAELIARKFDADMVPELGLSGVDGIAVGRAILLPAPLEETVPAKGPPAEERARLERALAKVEQDVAELLGALAPSEAQLFAPELEILRALGPRILERIDGGEQAEEAVRLETSQVTTDLLLDARARLVAQLSGANALAFSSDSPDGEHILVVDALTPSIVAMLPRSVVGIVASAEEDVAHARAVGYASHAAILARGRRIPLAFVPAHVGQGISSGSMVVVDTTAGHARVWVDPSEALLQESRARRAAREQEHEESEERAALPLSHLGVAVRANIGGTVERVPRGAEGIGLLRTELVFAGRREAPSEKEQYLAVLAIARAAGAGPVVARLFDAGGDKPLTWLTPPAEAAGARGIELLLCHPAILRVQVCALCRVADAATVSILLPLARKAEDIRAVRALCTRSVPVGAMIETESAVRDIDAIVQVADFVCIGTNDLTADVLKVGREHAGVSFDRRVLRLVREVIVAAHAHGKAVTVCGEIAGVERGARILVGMGVDAISVAPPRVSPVKISLLASTLEDCRVAAAEAV